MSGLLKITLGNWKKIYTCPSTYEEQIYTKETIKALVEINCASFVEHFQLNQSSYEEWGAAVHPGWKGSSDPQQCQYWKTSPESGVSMVPPV